MAGLHTEFERRHHFGEFGGMFCTNQDLGGQFFLLTNFGSTSAIFKTLYLSLNYCSEFFWRGTGGGGGDLGLVRISQGSLPCMNP